MGIEKGIFNRTSLLLGDDVMGDIYQKRVIIFGLGGVGSWCAESLVRSGIKELVLVDSDRVCVTNVNRQLMATTKTVGQVKVEVLKNRLFEINPHANIVALQDIYEEANTDKFQLDTFDYIIDAIDSLENKMQLLWHATRTKATVFSSMGAAPHESRSPNSGKSPVAPSPARSAISSRKRKWLSRKKCYASTATNS